MERSWVVHRVCGHQEPLLFENPTEYEVAVATQEPCKQCRITALRASRRTAPRNFRPPQKIFWIPSEYFPATGNRTPGQHYFPGTRRVGQNRTEQTVMYLQALMAEHLWQAGEKIPSVVQWAEALDISVSAVQEALGHLQKQGWLVLGRRGQFFVTPGARSRGNMRGSAEIHALHDLLSVRRLIEPEAARQAAQRGEAAVARSLQRTLQAMQVSGAADADTDFHLIILKSGKNPVWATMVKPLEPLIRHRMALSRVVAGTGDTLLEEHWKIYTAIATQRPAAAAEAMADHLDNVTRRLKFVTSQH